MLQHPDIANHVAIYKQQPVEKRQHYRARTDYLANSPSSDPAQKVFNSALLEAMQQAEKELSPVPLAQTVKFELPDISGQSVLRLGKYIGVLGGFGVGLYAIGAIAVGIAASIAAFFAAWGVYLVAAGVVAMVLCGVDWGGNSDAETVESQPANQQNITINVTASNGGNVTVNKETI